MEERVLGEVQESSFYCFARRRGPQGANLPRDCVTQPGGHSEEEFVVFKEQGVISSWMVLRLVDDQGEVSGIISLLVSASLGLCFCVSNFHLEETGLLPVKTTWNVCQAFI